MSDANPFRELPVGARQRVPGWKYLSERLSKRHWPSRQRRARPIQRYGLSGPDEAAFGSEYEVVPRSIPSSVSLIGYRGRFILRGAP